MLGEGKRRRAIRKRVHRELQSHLKSTGRASTVSAG